MGRLTPEEQVIDLAIALESTICADGGSDQLSYRFRLFCAAVLADASGGEHEFKMLRGLYNARSAVVHGGKGMSEVAEEREMKALFRNRSVSDFVGECRELTRRIILDFLSEAAKGRSPKEYVQALERVMVCTARSWHRILAQPPVCMGGSASLLTFVLLLIDRVGQRRAVLAQRVEQLQDAAGIAEGHDGAGHLVPAIDY